MTEFQGRGQPLTYGDVESAAEVLGVTPQTLWAVVRVETAGCGFLPDKRPLMRFERHIFARQTNNVYSASHPNISGPRGRNVPSGYAALMEAVTLNRRAALESASWGLGQIMGFNYVQAGYDDVETMVAEAVDAEEAQLHQMVSFICHSPILPCALESADWAEFAAAYNGPAYRENRYDTKLVAAAKLPLPDFTVRAGQMLCLYAGIDPGPVDGVMGAKTRAAFEEMGWSA